MLNAKRVLLLCYYIVVFILILLLFCTVTAIARSKFITCDKKVITDSETTEKNVVESCQLQNKWKLNKQDVGTI